MNVLGELAEGGLAAFVFRHGVDAAEVRLKEHYRASPVEMEGYVTSYLWLVWRYDKVRALGSAASFDELPVIRWPPFLRGDVRRIRLRFLYYMRRYSQFIVLAQASPPGVNADFRHSLSDSMGNLNLERRAASHLAALREPPGTLHRSPRSRGDSSPLRVLYFAHHSYPYVINGYSHRTSMITRHLAAAGCKVILATRIGFPFDRQEVGGADFFINQSDLTFDDGVTHVIEPDRRRNLHTLDIEAYMATAGEQVERLIERFSPDIVHAASNYVTGLPALQASRKTGIPFVYEARGAWEVTRASREPSYGESDGYRIDAALERQCALSADLFVAINRSIRDRAFAHRTDRGGHRIHILPNGATFSDEDTAGTQRHRRLRNDRLTLGYFGSIVDYEGLDLLLKAAARAKRRHGRRINLVIVGDGPYRKELQRLAQALGIADQCDMPGKIDPSMVAAQYERVDAMCFPRRSWPVTELVSPLKPLEAMNAGKPFIVSSVAPLLEIVEEARAGFVFAKDELESLTDLILRLDDGQLALDESTRNGRRFVKDKRNWSVLTADLVKRYEEIVR